MLPGDNTCSLENKNVNLHVFFASGSKWEQMGGQTLPRQFEGCKDGRMGGWRGWEKPERGSHGSLAGGSAGPMDGQDD